VPASACEHARCPNGEGKSLVTGAASPPMGVPNPTIGGGEALRELTLTANPTP
jgi:hypothetical protein